VDVDKAKTYFSEIIQWRSLFLLVRIKGALEFR
jgi:hypothetical protein